MGRTKKCDLREDESLAEAVREFRCLYDKSCKEYREKDRVANAWKKVEEELGCEEGKVCTAFYQWNVHVLKILRSFF